MNTSINRRIFLKLSGTALAAAAVLPKAFAADKPAAPARKRDIRKAIMYATIGYKGSVMEKFKACKEAGFEGVEAMSHMNQDEVLRARDETGLAVPSVCGQHHWSKTLSHPDAKVREEGLDALKQTLRDAKKYGATSILLVCGTVNDKVTYEDCWKRSIEGIRAAVPLAGELAVKISVENVWNGFITKEDEAARYLDEINSPWVGWHFDVGNIIWFGDPIDWIKKLGKRINRLHIKEFSLDLAKQKGNRNAGFNVKYLEGSNNWPGIMKALDEVGYAGGWGIAEQPGGDSLDGLRDLAQRMDKIFAS